MVFFVLILILGVYMKYNEHHHTKQLLQTTNHHTKQLLQEVNHYQSLNHSEFDIQNVSLKCPVVVLIPYRNRATHYHKQMHNLRKIFSPTCKPTIIVIEQDNIGFFKRGWLFNIGLDIISLRNLAPHTCVVTHDVDLLASSSKNYLSCEKPTQLCSELSCFNHGVPYAKYTGGVVSASLNDWKTVNGYSNSMEGWGGEDDHLYWRFGVTQLLNSKKIINRPPKGSGVCQCLNDDDHTQRKRAPSYKNIGKILNELQTGTAWRKDGLSNLQYFITKQFIDKYGTQWYKVSEKQPLSSLSNSIVHTRKVYTCTKSWASKISQTIFAVDNVQILTKSSKTTSSDILVNTFTWYNKQQNCRNLPFNGKKIVFDGESVDNNAVVGNKQDFYYVGRSQQQPLFLGQISCTYAAMSMFHRIATSPLLLLKPRQNTGKHFLLYTQSNCIQHRQNAFDMIVDLARANHLQDPHALGTCAGKHTELKIQHAIGNWIEYQHTMHSYRFTLAMENRVKAGYITEKIINAFLGGTIPIYYGTLDVLSIFNPKSFIFFDILNPTAALDEILWLEQNPDEYYKKLTQPILLDGNATLEKYFSLSDEIGGGKLRHEILNMLRGPKKQKKYFSSNHQVMKYQQYNPNWIWKVERKISFKGTQAVVCIPPKAGSTSFWTMLIKSILISTNSKKSLKRILLQCDYVQNLDCVVKNVEGVKILNQVDKNVFSVRITRNPLHRLLSAWKTKVRCKECRNNETFDELHTNTCMSFKLFVENLYNSQFFVKNWDEHWQPQTSLCPSNYHETHSLEETNEHQFDELLKHLKIKKMTYNHLHKTNFKTHDNDVLSSNFSGQHTEKDYFDTLTRIYEIYAKDYALFTYNQDMHQDSLYLNFFFSKLPQFCL